MKTSIIATMILVLTSSTAFANGNKQSNAHDYHPGAIDNQNRLADINPNYELTYPSEKEGYTMYDNKYISEGGTYTTYEKPNPTDVKHIADKGSLKVIHGQGGMVITEYTIKGGQHAFTVMCGYTSGPSYWAEGKAGNVCKDAQALAKALEEKSQWKQNPMVYTKAPDRILAE